VIGHWILPPHINSLMKRWDLIPQETTFWRRRMFEKAGNVDPSFRFAMDYDLFVRYMTVGKFRRVNRFLAAFRVHDAAKTSTQVHTVGKEEVEQIRKKYGLRAPQLIGRVYSLSVRLRSAYALKKRVALPGLPPGDDFSISELWNWQLPPSNLTARGYD
ncbi:MAG: hypothetical protein J7559_23360, partial [Cohnella sp.]|nr:hypothetical protein [Cohnella sp.]